MATYTVIDVSKYNTVSDYNAAAKTIDGVIIRAGYRGYGSTGTLVTDSSFLTHYNGFKGKTKIGVYWFSQAITASEAVAEANYLYELIKDKNIDFPVYIDSEYSNTSHNGRADGLSKSERTNVTIAFCDRMSTLGYNVGVYASDSWFNSNLNLPALQNKKYSIWVARYSTNPPQYVSNYDGWQYTSTSIVTGVNGNCDMSKFYNDVAGWVTVKPDINDYELIVTDTVFDYTGEEIRPAFSIVGMYPDTDYTYIYSNNVNAGTGTCKITAKGLYTGSRTFNFTINKLSILDKSIKIEPDIFNYTGEPVKGVVTVEGLTYTDFDVSYSNNVNAGVGTATATGVKNYKDSLSVNFTIVSNSIIPSDFYIEKTEYKATGYAIEPEVKCSNETLIKNIDYTISYYNNIEIGTGKILINGIGNYNGSTTITFDITNMSILEHQIYLSNYTFIYSGLENKPIVIVEGLIENKDFSVKYENNIVVGTGIVTVIGIGDYIGEKELTFTINKQSISDRELNVSGYVFYYNTQEICPNAEIVGLKENRDYGIVYNDNIVPGTANVTANGIGNYSGSIIVEYEIIVSDIKKCVAKVGRASTKTIYRIKTDDVLHIYTDDSEKIELREMFDYEIISFDSQEFDEFTMYIYQIKGIGGYNGDVLYRFRLIDTEPDIPFDYEDDGIYNFGSIDDGDESAYGNYDFKDIDIIDLPTDNIESDSTEDDNINLLSDDEDIDLGEVVEEDSEEEVPDMVIDGMDYDFDQWSGMLLDTYDEDTGQNIDKDGKTEEEEKEPKGDDDDGVYNFGDIDEGDETAEGDYGFGSLDEGADEGTVAKDNEDYDFNKFAGDVEEWLAAGTEFELDRTSMYETYSSSTSFAERSGTYFIYDSSVVNGRVRMCRLGNNVEIPGKVAGWCKTIDLLNLGELVEGNQVAVNGRLYLYANGSGGFVAKEGDIMYITEILDSSQYEFPYGISSGYKTARIGFASHDMLTKVENL